MHQLIRDYFAPAFDLKELNDAAVIELKGQGTMCRGQEGNKFQFAFTTDSYVVTPLFFPGGDIGKLAVNGTVNDLSVVGAIPLYLSSGFIIEEGFPMSDMKAILQSMAIAAKNANVRIIAGDTKVVDRGKADGIYINTSGVGIMRDAVDLGAKNIKIGDKVITSGFIGSHGIAVLAERNGLTFSPPVLSDTAPLNGLIDLMMDFSSSFDAGGAGHIRMMRDPTRGGIATTLKEITGDSGFYITINETSLPVQSGVKGACELLGLDPLYVANEGILIAVVSPDIAEPLVQCMRSHAVGQNASVIGEVSDSDSRTRGMVLLKTLIGGTRIIDMLAGEQLARIC